MYGVWVALLSVVTLLLHVGTAAAQGNVATGKTLWEGDFTQCRNCHGVNGQGGFGPDLAGRQLTLEQFSRATRLPWGVMPAYTQDQLGDQQIADLQAYLASLPKVTEVAPWRIALPAGAPVGQELLIAGIGCAQCHGATVATMRRDVGAIGAGLDWFRGMVYNHTTVMPQHRALIGEPVAPVRMGNYSRARVPESVLREMWAFVESLGARVPVLAELSPPVSAAAGTTHTLTLENIALVGKGLAAQDLTITLTVAPGFTVASATGAGYQGVRPDGEAKADTAVWQVPSLGPKEKQTYTITLQGSGTGPAIPRGVVRWPKPAQGDGSGDQQNVAIRR